MRLQTAEHWALLFDFDGTLVQLKRRPDNVRLSERARRTLERLVSNRTNFVAIVSGRRYRTLRDMVGIAGVHYFGLHGAEREGESTAVCEEQKRALLRAKRVAGLQLETLPGIWIEDKGITFAVHYRDAGATTIQAAERVLTHLLAPLHHALQVLRGNKVWEVLPKGISGKGGAVRAIVDALPPGTVTIYVGDDETDEAAFAVLKKEITVRVGRTRTTRAHFYVRNPTDVLHLLSRLEKGLP
jgi:trehalose 6-phosphate phosphatase